MPVHRCSFNALEETVERIEQSGQRIIAVTAPTDSTCVIVTYEPSERAKPKGVERR